VQNHFYFKIYEANQLTVNMANVSVVIDAYPVTEFEDSLQ